MATPMPALLALSALMRDAWRSARAASAYRLTLVVGLDASGRRSAHHRPSTGAERRAVFVAALRRVWADAKMFAAWVARQAAPRTPADVLRAEVEALENTDRLGPAGIERLSALRAELARLTA